MPHLGYLANSVISPSLEMENPSGYRMPQPIGTPILVPLTPPAETHETLPEHSVITLASYFGERGDPMVIVRAVRL